MIRNKPWYYIYLICHWWIDSGIDQDLYMSEEDEELAEDVIDWMHQNPEKAFNSIKQAMDSKKE